MKTTLLAALLMLLSSIRGGATESFDITVNTSPLNLMSGYLAFDFLGGTPVDGNVVDVSNFSTDGTTGALTTTGAASGTVVGGTGSLNDSQFFNELLQEVTFGTTISFELSLTTLVPGTGTPDEFSFYLLDASQNPYLTSDPTGADSLFSITIDSTTLTPLVFTSTFAVATVTPAGSQTAPEPGFFGLFACGVLVFLIWRRIGGGRLSCC